MDLAGEDGISVIGVFINLTRVGANMKRGGGGGREDPFLEGASGSKK